MNINLYTCKCYTQSLNFTDKPKQKKPYRLAHRVGPYLFGVVCPGAKPHVALLLIEGEVGDVYGVGRPEDCVRKPTDHPFMCHYH